MGEAGAWAAHCPTSNSALGSGLFPLRRHVEHGVGVALGSDVGAGTGLFLPKEGLQAYFMQQLLGGEGLPLSPVHLLYLATRAGALALGLADRVGDFTPGKDFDAVWLRPADGSTYAVNLRTPPTPPTRSPGPSRSPPPPTWPACGSAARESLPPDPGPGFHGWATYPIEAVWCHNHQASSARRLVIEATYSL